MSQTPEEIARVLAEAPESCQARLRQLRDLIHAAGEATGTAPLSESLKWGQPSLAPKRSHGTPIRLGWDADGETCRIYVHCQTDLVSRWRDRYAAEFDYLGNREVVVPAQGTFAEAAFQQMAAMALTYHRDKAKQRS